MAAKPLPSQRYLLECFDYDPETGLLTWKERPRKHFVSDGQVKNWNGRFAGKVAGTVVGGYIQICARWGCWKAHRIIWKIVYGSDPDQIDHINRDRQDNRLKNLRECSGAENAINRSLYKNNKSGFKAVSLRNGRWRATIQLKGRAVHVGTFATPDAAHIAYCEAAERLHREFASFG